MDVLSPKRLAEELSADKLKKFFTGDSEDAKRLIRLGSDRVKAGRRDAVRNAHVWAAVDLAFDAPFYQCSPTIMRHLIATCKTPEDVKNACAAWGVPLDQMFCVVKDDSGRETYELNAPVFFQTLVPVVRAYVAIRLAKLFNERNTTPLFRFLPQNYTAENRLRCEIITDLTQQIVQQFGYKAILRQMILQALLYSQAILFPLEPWFEELSAFGNEKTVTRQGIRYITPHVSRCFVDRAFAPCTLNTETGCEYAGYWTVARWGDISDKEDEFFNLDKVPIGPNPLSDDKMSLYLREIFPCALEFPEREGVPDPNQRERVWYSENERDNGVLVSTIFMRVVPSRYGLAKHDQPVWLRLTYASDETVISATYFPYRPVTYCGYDSDQGRAANPSLALEIIPFQDQLGNLLSQLILTIKRNLANIVFYDVNVIDPAQIESLRKHTQKQYTEINFVAFDSLKDRVAQRPSASEAIHEVRFSWADVNQILSAFSAFMSTLERMLNFSAQELGGQATHQQSKAEVEIIAQATSQRLAYTGSFIDEAIAAWKQQLYLALHHYYNGEFIAQISADVPDAAKILGQMGFEMTAVPQMRRIAVKGKADKLLETLPVIDLLASDLPGPGNRSDRETAQAVLLALQAASGNPLLAQRLDPKGVRDLLVYAAKLMGADPDFEIKLIDPKDAQGQGAADPNAMANAILQLVAQKFAQPMAAELQKLAQNEIAQEKKIADVIGGLDALKQAVMQMMRAIEEITAATKGAMPQPAVPPGGIPPTAPPPLPPLPVGQPPSIAAQPAGAVAPAPPV